MRTAATVVCGLLALFCLSGVAQAGWIDMNEFFSDNTVSVSSDGRTASFIEDRYLSPMYLENDPGFGDTQVIFPATGQYVSFDYDFFTGGTDEANRFRAFMIDDSGAMAGSAWEFITDQSGTGTVTWDLSNLVGETYVGLRFEMEKLAGDKNLDSTLTITDVVQWPPYPSDHPAVPLPAAAWLGFGLLGILGAARRFRRRR